MKTSFEREVFGDVLENIQEYSIRAWLYLPEVDPWSVNAPCIIAESEDVPESIADTSEPAVAREHGLQRALPVAVVQDIVGNAREQLEIASRRDLFKAFVYYYDHDAFIDFKQRR